MAEFKGKQIASVTMSNPFQDGINDANARIEELNLQETLVAGISADMWDSWDASHEDALVADNSEEDCEQIAA